MWLLKSHIIALETSSMSLSDTPSPPYFIGSSSRKIHPMIDEDEDKEDGVVHLVKTDLSLLETITTVIIPLYTVIDVDLDYIKTPQH